MAFTKLSEACNKDGTCHKAFYLRGKCFYYMADFQRALYDLSVAIRCGIDKGARREEIAEYYVCAGTQLFESG